MDNKPLCQYCGPWNGHPNGAKMDFILDEMMFGGPTGRLKFQAHYMCNCGATTPKGYWSETLQEAKASALTMALRRFQPMQKPLNFEEAWEHLFRTKSPEPLYIEVNRDWLVNHYEDTDKRYMWFMMLMEPWCNVTFEKNLIRFEKEHYNSRFRFWRKKPNDGECDAAKWEEKN